MAHRQVSPMKIAGAGSAFPQHVYSQQEISGALKDLWREELENPALLDRLHARCGVERRPMVLPLAAYPQVDTFGKANNLWIENAQQLGKDAICRAITPAGIRPADINALYVMSVTGVASPSLDARLVNRMGLSPQLKRNPIFGLGCVGGAAGIARAADYVRAYPDQVAVVLAVELCSLTWQRRDLSMANLISSGLFADGAAAVVISGADTDCEGPEIVATRSTFYPNTEDVMGWDISQDGFRIVLSPDVPRVIEENLRRDADSFLAEHGLDRSRIASWIVHTGGPKVLEAVEHALQLPDKALEASWECLRRVGNMSSVSVLLVLQEYLARRRGEPGSYSVLAAMGPGFCSELVLLRW
ncbi:MAG TPA: 3-oxoacyl-[acyl-carrier-protein] synthase III C-terminal domain-containing protein [Terriglobales bacterium]|nr:3-oxoacyl-[acyl-carrier-protein] synthase III C-terminal domain-containing protein [Terriglobales bacterium]